MSRAAAEYAEKLRGPLLHFFGTTDPALLAEVWADRAAHDDETARTDRASDHMVLAPPPPAPPAVCGLTDWTGTKCTEPAACYLCQPHMTAIAACVDPSDTALLDGIEGKLLQVGRTDDEPPRVLVWWTREGMSGLVTGVGDTLREAVRVALAAT